MYRRIRCFQGGMSDIARFVYAKDNIHAADLGERQGEVRRCSGGSDQRETRTFVSFVRLVSKQHYYLTEQRTFYYNINRTCARFIVM